MRIALAIALTLTGAAQSFAGTYSVTPVFAGAFSTDGSFTPIAGYDPLSTVPAIVQVDLLLNTGGFGAGELGFANGVFTVEFEGGGLSNLSVPGYQASPVNPTVDSNGPTPGGQVPLVTDNTDIGDTTDLKDILVGVATPLTTNPAVDPRFKFGQGGTANFLLGSIFVDYNGQGKNFVNVGFTQASYLGTDPNAARTIGVVDANANMPIGALQIGNIPEPTTCVLAGLALVGAAARRRV